MSGKRCELLDEDKDSVPSSRFGSDESYEYYDLQQRIVKATSLLNAPADCGNGCCAQHKCLNGGTCVERCKDPKLKFSCNCRPPWSGRFCGKRVYSSCWEKHAFATHNGENLIDGLYTLRTSNGEEFLTYCLFTSAVVWTLIESFAFRYREEFKDKPFFVNYTLPYNPSQPIWEKFRLSRDAMLHVRANSSRFKSECAYNKRDQITGFPKDSILADLSEYDIMQHTEKSGSCVTLETAFIRGQECSSTPCTVSAWHIKNHHLHFDTTSNAQCTYKPTGSVASEDSFGYYFNANPESTCSENDDSTTQWWLGEELL
ncbi:predicted protein [Nematostella vectensis]|uniref:EGF-like domain-containing protein n=1 Tax=Nematostella vectensis TaxID=45351 RepID=A7SBA0_NEMVE|nr:predicted protein [Nematostella vectensis]|eukprot:XP_001631024.1 predicted protein [Nematostella vectensis]